MDEERMNSGEQRLIRLHDSDDYEVSDKDPDVQGWDVIGADGVRLGRVDDLIADRQLMKARYLDVELHDDFVRTTGGKHILVPVGLAALSEEDDRVLVDRLDRNSILGWPIYSGGPVNRDLETSIHDALATEIKPSEVLTDRDFYDSDYYDDTRFHRTRLAGGG